MQSSSARRETTECLCRTCVCPCTSSCFDAPCTCSIRCQCNMYGFFAVADKGKVGVNAEEAKHVRRRPGMPLAVLPSAQA